jgi:Putative transposase/Transposase zinc-binding domain
MVWGCRPPARRPERGGERLQLAEVLEAALPTYCASYRLPRHHWKILNALLDCRTERLGGHLYRCQDCGRDHFVAHSCRNRHCPRCQRAQADQWLQRQTQSLLPVSYYHLVFTVPHLLNPLIAQNQRALYKLLFAAASATLLEFGRHRFKAQIGVTAVLHTWSQTLSAHYHLHCVVTGGGLRLDGRGWQSASEHYLFAVRALSQVFRAKFRDGLQALYRAGHLGFHGALAALKDPAAFEELLAGACSQEWIVYAKKPFAGPQAVLSYLSRYTHRVALAESRLLALDRNVGSVTFSYKDYADKSRRKKMTLHCVEFLRRFALHFLPERLVKIRHYGLLANRHRRQRIGAARTALGGAGAGLNAPLPRPVMPPSSPRRCPQCGSHNLIFVERRPPLRTVSVPADTS